MKTYIAIFSDSTNERFSIEYTEHNMEIAVEFATRHVKNNTGITLVTVIDKENLLDNILRSV